MAAALHLRGQKAGDEALADAALAADNGNDLLDRRALMQFLAEIRLALEFRRLKAERETIETKLTELNGRIEEMVWQYQNNSESLVKRISIFNECASKAGCFKTDSEFNSQRTQLLDEQSELNDIRDNLVELIEQYNALVEKYNRNILRDQELFNMMNSNIEKIDLIK